MLVRVEWVDERMELRRYLEAIGRRWRLVLFVAGATTLITAFFVARQPSVYTSSGTFVVRPSAQLADEAVAATNALIRGAEINSTYARIARSDVVKRDARQLVREEGLPTSGLGVRSSVVPGTNIIEIGASGQDPDAVAAYAEAVGEVTMAYLDEIGDVFTLEQLDSPEVPSQAESTNRELTIGLGLVFGLTAGSVLAFALEYAREQPDRAALNIRDPLTGAYSPDYFRLRLREEMSRCNLPSHLPLRLTQEARTSKLFTVVSISMHLGELSSNGTGPPPRPADLRDAAESLQSRLRAHDVLAYIGDQRFLLICPDLSQKRVRVILNEWNSYLGSSWAGERGVDGMHAEVQTCQCDAEGVLGDRESIRIAYDL